MPTQLSQTRPAASGRDQRTASLDQRLAVLFWALLCLLVGGISLFGVEKVPGGTWLIGLGVILLSLNAVRFVKRIPVRVIPTVLGVVALAAGLAELTGATFPVIPLTLIAIGASMIVELLTARQA
jgi:hypothetical protein